MRQREGNTLGGLAAPAECVMCSSLRQHCGRVCEGMFVFRKIYFSVSQDDSFELYRFYVGGLNPLHTLSVSDGTRTA